MWSVVLAAGGLLAPTGAGCSARMCNDQIDSNALYQVTVVQAYTAQSTFLDPSPIDPNSSCGASSPIAAGTQFQLQAHGAATREGQSCLVVQSEAVGSVGSVSIEGPPANMFANNILTSSPYFMTAGGHVTLATGDGDLILGFRTAGGSGGIYATPVPGQYPQVVLDTYFYPATNNPSCGDEFVVQLAKE
ncbi:MAG TPA: hypothetical protein VHO06_23890 [Polyangia bacterium]|nr:hypothetical protein [Polyangia bacterium]